MKKYVLYIDMDDRILECILPGEDNRKGCLDLALESGIPDLKIDYEVWDGVWHILSNRYVRISLEHIAKEDMILQEGEIVSAKILQNGRYFSIMVCALDRQTAIFDKYDIRTVNQIHIGSDNGCEIILKDTYVSKEHAVIVRQNGGWYISDRSTNGTYINGERLLSARRLRVGDIIYITGFKIIYMGTMLAVNQRERRFIRLRECVREQLQDFQIHEDISMFSRTPRQIEPLDEEEIEIEAPPSPAKATKTPLLYILGPSLTMPVPILTMVLFNIMAGASGGSSALSYAGMAISVVMFAVLGIFWTIMRNRYDRKTLEENEKKRQTAYQMYLRQNEQAICEKQIKNKNILEHMYRKSELLITELINNRFSLWNRNVNHEDFLCVRMGEGYMESPNHIKIPKQRFSVSADPLASLPGQIFEKYKYLAPAVKILDLKKNKLIGIVGDKKEMSGVVNSMLVQICALHSYTDVKIAFLTAGEEVGMELKWARWLPHVFSDDKKIRFFSDDEETGENVKFALTSVLRERREAVEGGDGKKIRFTDHYVVFTTKKEVYEADAIYRYMKDGGDYGFTFILAHEKMDALPNECKCIIELSPDFHGIYMLDARRTSMDIVNFDSVSSELAGKFAKSISGVYIHELADTAIPEKVDFLSLLGIGRIEQWDLLKHYKENRSFEGIRSKIGVAANRKIQVLDIHEEKHGPHGLIAGMTGSGKSETIQTFILSLALNYHPDEVAFILIDYKGGGMANAFLGLPHLAGTITNLGETDGEIESIDDNQTRRALISIHSEIKRRQMIFKKYNVKHIDMYMRLYREGKANEAMPHLIIISDEFAELKKEQPEFIKELVSAARVGRSLGIHLILATQKPTGVVDDEIWSNSRFKICLRVQDRQDSMGMLKRPEAAMLTRTGRAYLQIGNDELFEMFQSGYSGAVYEPKEENDMASGDEAEMINLDGTEAVLRPRSGSGEGQSITQLEVCVKYIIDQCVQYHIEPAMPLWLPKLSGSLALTDLEEKYTVKRTGKIYAVLGLIDYPEMQKQYPLGVDLLQTSNLLIAGMTGCGKTTMLKTMLMSLAGHYTPGQVQMYCLDFSSRTLKVFEDLPHIGGVVFSEEEERVVRLFRLLAELVTERRKLLEERKVGSIQEYIKTGCRMPLILLIVDNMLEFMERFPKLEEDAVRLTRDGIRYGICTIATVNRAGDIRRRIRQNFEKILPIQLADKGEYMDVFGSSPKILPEHTVGRGLVLDDGILEYQTALPAPGENESERREYLEKWIDKYCEGYQGVYAPAIPVLPVSETAGEFFDKHRKFSEEHEILPFAYDRNTLHIVGVNLRTDYCVAVSSGREEGIENSLSVLMYAAKRYGARVDYVRQGMETTDRLEKLADSVSCGYEEVRELLIRLKKEFKASVKYHPDTLHFVFVRNMREFMELVYDAKNPEVMYPLIETFFQNGAQRGIYFVAGFLSDVQNSYLYMQACRFFTGYRKFWHAGGALNQQKLTDYPVPMVQQARNLPLNEGFGMDKDKVTEIYVPRFDLRDEDITF